MTDTDDLFPVSEKEESDAGENGAEKRGEKNVFFLHFGLPKKNNGTSFMVYPFASSRQKTVPTSLSGQG